MEQRRTGGDWERRTGEGEGGGSREEECSGFGPCVADAASCAHAANACASVRAIGRGALACAKGEGLRGGMPVRAVLFDLDDTLVDTKALRPHRGGPSQPRRPPGLHCGVGGQGRCGEPAQGVLSAPHPSSQASRPVAAALDTQGFDAARRLMAVGAGRRGRAVAAGRAGRRGRRVAHGSDAWSRRCVAEASRRASASGVPQGGGAGCRRKAMASESPRFALALGEQRVSIRGRCRAWAQAAHRISAECRPSGVAQDGGDSVHRATGSKIRTLIRIRQSVICGPWDSDRW